MSTTTRRGAAIAAGLAALFLAAAAVAEGLPTLALPAELRPFVLPGTRPIALARADLDGDGQTDVLLVLERIKARPTDDDIEDGQRPLLVLLRQADGALKLAGRNDQAVFCATCGGMMGDPFEAVTASAKSFTVSNSGGSAWRWSSEYRFAYSRRDATWQLVRVTERSFHTSAPEKAKTVVSTPPKNFGRIDLADFDPLHWKDRGAR